MSQIEQAKAKFETARDQMLENFAKIPDEKLNWSPAETARTPIEILVHCGDSIGHLTGMMQGRRFEPETTADADRHFREHEKSFTSREQALNHFNAHSGAFITHLAKLSEDDLEQLALLPFGMGEAPLSLMITLPTEHTKSHTPQLEYLQTCYGDRSWLELPS